MSKVIPQCLEWSHGMRKDQAKHTFPAVPDQLPTASAGSPAVNLSRFEAASLRGGPSLCIRTPHLQKNQIQILHLTSKIIVSASFGLTSVMSILGIGKEG